jgi:hypothetical protein
LPRIHGNDADFPCSPKSSISHFIFRGALMNRFAVMTVPSLDRIEIQCRSFAHPTRFASPSGIAQLALLHCTCSSLEKECNGDTFLVIHFLSFLVWPDGIDERPSTGTRCSVTPAVLCCCSPAKPQTSSKIKTSLVAELSSASFLKRVLKGNPQAFRTPESTTNRSAAQT